MYYYELHLHTAETSRCGRSPAKDMVRDYYERGFTGVVITDHFVNGNSYAARWCEKEASWKERMDIYLRGYYAALEEGKKLNFPVYFGWEYTYRGTGEDYLILGTKPGQMYSDFVDCDRWTIEQLIDKVHMLGGIVIRAHPYRIADYMTISCIERPGLDIDAVEAFNAGNASEQYNLRAVDFAKKENKPMVAGSDTHHIMTNAAYYVGFEDKPADEQDLCRQIKEGLAVLYHRGEIVSVNN